MRLVPAILATIVTGALLAQSPPPSAPEGRFAATAESGKTCSIAVTGTRGDGQAGRDFGRSGPSCSMMRPTRADKRDGYLLGS